MNVQESWRKMTWKKDAVLEAADELALSTICEIIGLPFSLN